MNSLWPVGGHKRTEHTHASDEHEGFTKAAAAVNGFSCDEENRRTCDTRIGEAHGTSRRSASESSPFTMTFSAPSFFPFLPSSVANSTQLPSRLSSPALSPPSPAGGGGMAAAAAPPWRALPPSLLSHSSSCRVLKLVVRPRPRHLDVGLGYIPRCALAKP